jgi:hypothetical protein
MNDLKKYGPEDMKAARWVRVVLKLDEIFPQWRKTEEFACSGYDEQGRFLGDRAVQAISSLAEQTKHFVAEQTKPVVPDHSTWENSYTKSIVDVLNRLQTKLQAVGLSNTLHYSAVVSAIKLLQEYHRTQHEVYDQRDAARAEASGYEEQLTTAHEELETLKGELKALKKISGEYYRAPVCNAILKLGAISRSDAADLIRSTGFSTVPQIPADKLKETLRKILAKTSELTRVAYEAALNAENEVA